MEAKHTPGPDMIRVSREHFFATVGQMDVHPRTDMASLKGRYHHSVWESPNRVAQGESFSDSWGAEPRVYFARAAIAKAAGQ